ESFRMVFFRDQRFETGSIADEDDAGRQISHGLRCAANNGLRSVVAAHRIHGNRDFSLGGIVQQRWSFVHLSPTFFHGTHFMIEGKDDESTGKDQLTVDLAFYRDDRSGPFFFSHTSLGYHSITYSNRHVKPQFSRSGYRSLGVSDR